MLHVLGFDRLGIVLSDLYFLDPHPGPGQEGAERGVRLELRFVELQPHEGSIYASRPILLGRPLWRVDLLESVDRPMSLDRAHHHPRMRGWEPGGRRFEVELSADPLAWLADQLEHLEQFVDESESRAEDLSSDFEQLRRASDEILVTVKLMLDRVSRGELARVPSGVAGHGISETGTHPEAGTDPEGTTDPEGARLIRSGWL